MLDTREEAMTSPECWYHLQLIALLGNRKLPTGLKHCEDFAGFQLNRPQMLDNLFAGVPLSGHDADLLGCGLVEHSAWTRSNPPCDAPGSH